MSNLQPEDFVPTETGYYFALCGNGIEIVKVYAEVKVSGEMTFMYLRFVKGFSLPAEVQSDTEKRYIKWIRRVDVDLMQAE